MKNPLHGLIVLTNSTPIASRPKAKVERRRYTIEDDMYLFAFYEVAGAVNMAGDLKRSEASIKARVAHLKKCGAWAALADMSRAKAEYRCAVGLPIDGEVP